MRILAVDTCEERLSLALSDGERAWSVTAAAKKRQDERLFPELRKLLKRAKWKLEDLDALAVCNGPGRFTGIRIGMTFVSILGRTLGKPSVAVSRLEALARRLDGTAGPERLGLVLPTLSAGKEEFYLQAFVRKNGSMEPEDAPSWAVDLGAGADRLGAGLPLFGPTALADKNPDIRRIPGGPAAAADLLAPALTRLSAGGPGPFSPLYLKPAGYER